MTQLLQRVGGLALNRIDASVNYTLAGKKRALAEDPPRRVCVGTVLASLGPLTRKACFVTEDKRCVVGVSPPPEGGGAAAAVGLGSIQGRSPSMHQLGPRTRHGGRPQGWRIY